MPRRYSDEFDSDADRTTLPRAEPSSNGQWVFGSIFAGLVLVGFSFGVWAGAGANKPKPTETAEAKKEPEKPAPVVTPPAVKPKDSVVEVKPKEPEPKPVEPEPKEPEPKPKEPEPKPKEPEPKPKEPEPKKVVAKAVSFKEVSQVFRVYCNNCHGAAGKPKGDVDLRTVASIKKGGSGGDILTPGDPQKSQLYLSIKQGTMPPEGKGPNGTELQLIHDWIASGAKERRRTIGRRRG